MLSSGKAALAKIAQLDFDNAVGTPTVVLIDVPHEEEVRNLHASQRPPEKTSDSFRRNEVGPEPDDLYGMHLLLYLSSEIQHERISKLIVPVVVHSGLNLTEYFGSHDGPPATPGAHGSHMLTNPARMIRYLDAGAVDVLTSPLSKERVHGLAVHAYRVNKEVMRQNASFLSRRNRKLSWVGVEEERPFAYLREAMVANLMDKICNPQNVGESIDPKYDYPDPRIGMC